MEEKIICAQAQLNVTKNEYQSAFQDPSQEETAAILQGRSDKFWETTKHFLCIFSSVFPTV